MNINIKRIVLLLLINFLGLYLGSLATTPAIESQWYIDITKAPWTPPGWVFGFAWTTIMICFAFYFSYAIDKSKKPQKMWVLYAIQWILNLSWNPLFFHYHMVLIALIVIIMLTLLIMYITLINFKAMKLGNVLIAPYLIWMCIATSLNGYIFVFN